jgi:hypothetical protein
VETMLNESRGLLCLPRVRCLGYTTRSLMKFFLLALLPCLFLTQCVNTQVAGGAARGAISKLYVVRNDNLHMSGMQPEVMKQIREMGINAELVTAPPAGDVYYMTYTAHWQWDMAMYLHDFSAELHRGNATVGSIEYEVGPWDGLDLNKFGHTDDKIRPLLRQLLLGEQPVKSTKPRGDGRASGTKR